MFKRCDRFSNKTKHRLLVQSQNELLQTYLKQTHKRVLVEASPLDTIWGIGVDETDPRATEPAQWLGLNVLGCALMKARSLI